MARQYTLAAQIELAVRRTAHQASGSTVGFWLEKLADELAKTVIETKELKHEPE